MSTKSAVFFGNCQMDGLAYFLRKAGFPYQISVFENYKLILKEQTPEALTAAASKCDLFVYQPTREMAHGPLSSEYYVEKVIPSNAQTISVPYCYNHGFFPLIGHGDGFLGAAEMDPRYWQMTREYLLAAYDASTVDFALWPRLLACAAEQAKRELQCDIRVSDYIVDHRQLPLFLNFNHPSSILFAHLAREVIVFLTDEEREAIPVSGLNEARLPCDLPLSHYVIEEYNMEMTAHPHAFAYYRNFLSLAWERHQRTQPQPQPCSVNS